jgi:hypothetical protein
MWERNNLMAGRMPPNEIGRIFGWLMAVAAISIFGVIAMRTPAMADARLFQQAVNYVFTGQVNPQNAPEIVDSESCVVVMRDPKFKRYIRYHLTRFKMDDALYEKKYSGRNASYELNVKGDDVVIEYLNMDKKTVAQGYRSAHIPLPGEIDQTRKALDIIFTKYCKREKPRTPF